MKGKTMKAQKMETAAAIEKPTRFTTADCKRFMREAAQRGTVNRLGGPVWIHGNDTPKQFAERLASGECRRATPREIRAYIAESFGGDVKWWLSTVEAMAGGLAALRGLAEYAGGQDRENIENELAPHLDAIAAVLEKYRKSYAESIRVIEAATA